MKRKMPGRNIRIWIKQAVRKQYITNPGPADWLLLSCLFSLLLLLIRIGATGETIYMFLLWNLFLAFVPYWIIVFAEKKKAWLKSPVFFGAIGITWLLFLPNSFYIITDLFHFRNVQSAPKWFDIALLLSFAWNGLLAGTFSLRQAEALMKGRNPRLHQWWLIYGIMLLNAIGIYIGRYRRFNSWDVINNPLALLQELGDLFFSPADSVGAWSMIICYSLLMTVLYQTIKTAGTSFGKHA